ncbi:MAG: hypothetical protein JXB07_04855 [Anaerolineae bacterium]|nr:hypothetical protein [Anaerolineae bacterium]
MTQRQRSDNWFNQALRQAPWRTQTQATTLVMATVIMVVVIGTLYLAQASRTSATGRRLQNLEAERQVLEQQNAQLRAEIAALQSVPRLIAEAERQGFRMAEAKDVEYLKVDHVSQVLVTTSASPVPDKDLVPVYDETLGSWLTRQITTWYGQLDQFFDATFGTDGTPEP